MSVATGSKDSEMESLDLSENEGETTKEEAPGGGTTHQTTPIFTKRLRIFLMKILYNLFYHSDAIDHLQIIGQDFSGKLMG